MQTLFQSEAWFYNDENIGAKVISPVELLVRFKKLVNVSTTNKKTLIDVQKALGQVLFFPPNVAGWKGGNTWIDSTSLLLRLSMPLYVLRGEGMKIKSKPHFEENPDDSPPADERGKINSDWSILDNTFKAVAPNKQIESMLDYLIQCDASRIDRTLLKLNWTDSDKDNLTLSIAAVMSLPEFQLI